jgi:hypothetical protein
MRPRLQRESNRFPEFMQRLLVLFGVVLTLAAPSAEAAEACAAAPSESLVSALLPQAPGLRPNVLKLALSAASCASQRGLVRRNDVMAVIDYSMPSSQPRLFVFDMIRHKLLFRELVAHGKSSGGDVASFFSNSPGSLATSLGLFVTADPYFGGNGYSLRLKGLEEGINDMAWDRAIVLHGASYVSRAAIAALGRLGRSWGCPAVRKEVARKVIDTLRGGSAVFAYYPDARWLSTSRFVRHNE